MGTRSHYLYRINQLLGKRYLDIPDLKRDRTDIAKAFPDLGKLEQMQALIDLLEAGEPIPDILKPPAKRRGARRKSLLDDAEIQRRRSAGESLSAIAAVAGLSRERIRQICQIDGNPSP